MADAKSMQRGCVAKRLTDARISTFLRDRHSDVRPGTCYRKTLFSQACGEHRLLGGKFAGDGDACSVVIAAQGVLS